MARKIRVTSVREVPVIGLDNRPDIDVEVVYHIEPYGPFTERMRKREYSAPEMRRRMDQRALEIEQLAGPEGA